jgi:hypothetical protein
MDHVFHMVEPQVSWSVSEESREYTLHVTMK